MRLLLAQMKPQMAAPLLLGSAIWHLAVLAVLVQTRVELSAVQRMAAGAHRSLLAESSDQDSLVSVARLGEAVDRLQDTLGSRLTAVERENNELKAVMKALKGAQAGTEHGNHARSDGNALDEAQMGGRRVAREMQNTTVDYIQLQLRTLQQRGDELEASVQALAEEKRRRVQGETWGSPGSGCGF